MKGSMNEHSIKTVYVVHHSHTDIGYTDLQERILDEQAHYIKTVLDMMENQEDTDDFRWNCETYFCVERFLEQASEEEKRTFFRLVKEKKIGISATYLNFNDLADSEVLFRRTAEIAALLASYDIDLKTAMIADINGISMGQRDVLLDNGVEFLFTNIHTHHGMYPMYQNQNAYWWENKAGRRLLVWNGEHYNLGNVLGIKPDASFRFMTENYCGKEKGEADDAVSALWEKLNEYLYSCEEQGYPYDFIVSAVSGVFSDNAPPNLEILRTIQAFHERYGTEIRLQMVSLQELYGLLKDKLADAPVVTGDLTDWWAGGVGSTPYAVKHYREAQRIYHLAERLDPKVREKHPKEARLAEDNLLLYAEHTWGHSATIRNPYMGIVNNLDMRKNSYASKAHENASLMLNRTALEMGDILRYYNTSGKIKAVHTGRSEKTVLVEFYVESMDLPAARVTELSTGRVLACQVSPHPRGAMISFTDTFQPGEEKEYSYERIPGADLKVNTRKVYVGAERVRDIVNDYDPITYRLPYELENKWFKLTYSIGDGFTSFYDKQSGCELLKEGLERLFTPVYECTEIHTTPYEERRLAGRNIRGLHAVCHQGRMTDIKCLEDGEVFTSMEFTYDLKGTTRCFVLVRFYKGIPKLEVKLRLAKTISEEIESVFMPLTLNLPDREVWIKKGAEAFRPGIDQLPGTCMEFYMSDAGVVYRTLQGSILVGTPDTPLLYMGQMKHHPIKLCDGAQENNQRAVYSWVMNNTWETNFKMDLSGYGEFGYTVSLSDSREPEVCFEELTDDALGTYVLMTE